MFRKFVGLTLVTLCVLLGQSYAQDECVPLPVQDLRLNLNEFLTWSVNSDEACEVTEFRVHIWETEGAPEYTFTVAEERANISNLSACHSYTFTVYPIANETTGPPQILVTDVPLPLDADLTIAWVNYTENVALNKMNIHWSFKHYEYNLCNLTYKVSVEEDGNAVIEYYYTNHATMDVNFLSPCTTYQFGVTANRADIGRPELEGPLKLLTHYMSALAQTPPTLVGVETGTTSANLTLRLDSKIRNPCEVTELYIDGDNSFEKFVDINDLEVIRQPVNVSVSGLQPNLMYFFRASVKNSGGWSNNTIAAFQTLEEST